MSFSLYVTLGLISPICYILFTCYMFLKKTWLSTRALKQFPMFPYTWVGGHMYMHPGFSHEGLLTFNQWTATFPRYFVFFFGPLRPILVLNHPESVKQMAKTAEPKCFVGGGAYALLKPWIGDGLLLSSGNKWHRNRRMLTPGFHYDILKSYMGVYNSSVELLMDKFDQSAQSGRSIDVYKPVRLCTLDIILRCAFSTQRNIQGQGDQDPYVNTVEELSTLVLDRVFNPVLYINWLYALTANGKRFAALCDYSHQFANDVIQKRRQELQTGSGSDKERSYVDFLDILLLARDEEGKGLSDTEIREEVETFMFEGHDTTASGISWILFNLARHPDIQARARADVDGVLHGRDSDWLQWNDMSEMPYLTMCIKESLRLHPPVYTISRETTKPFNIDDKIVPPGTIVELNIWMLNHNETVWKDPMTYDPDRFLPERLANMDSYAFMPFSAGPRNCIGQNFAMNEMKTAVARILHQFRISLDPSKQTKMSPDIVLRSKNGIHLNFQRREKLHN